MNKDGSRGMKEKTVTTVQDEVDAKGQNTDSSCGREGVRKRSQSWKGLMDMQQVGCSACGERGQGLKSDF